MSSSLLGLQRSCGNAAVQRMLADVQPQRENQSSKPSAEPPAIVREVLAASGRSLDASEVSFMEGRFGSDFSDVRVHADAAAAESAAAIDARAYTLGNHVVFGAGEYKPGTLTGRRLLAHELAHVLQQRASASPEGGLSRPPVLDSGSDGSERAADQAAEAVVSDSAPIVQNTSVEALTIRRKRAATLPESEKEPRPDLVQQIDNIKRLIAENVTNATESREKLNTATSNEAKVAAARALAEHLERRIPLLESVVEILEFEIRAQGGRFRQDGTHHASKAPPASAKPMAHMEFELQQYRLQLDGLRRWQMRKQMVAVARQLADHPVGDPEHEKLEGEKRRLGAALTASTHKFGQYEKPWGDEPYGDHGTISTSACGPTSLAVLLNYFQQEDPLALAAGTPLEITPSDTTKFAVAANARQKGRIGTVSPWMMGALQGATSDPQHYDPAQLEAEHVGVDPKTLEKIRRQSASTGVKGTRFLIWPQVRARQLHSYDEMVEYVRGGRPVMFSSASRDGGVTVASGKDQHSWKAHFMVVNGVHDDGSLSIIDVGWGKETVKLDVKQARGIDKWWFIEPATAIFWDVH